MSESHYRELIEWDWLDTLGGGRLHHVEPTVAIVAEMDEHGGLGRATASCGLRLQQAWIPGSAARMGATRCPLCCDALGYPRGNGSPKNDDTCRPLVEVRLAGVHQ